MKKNKKKIIIGFILIGLVALGFIIINLISGSKNKIEFSDFWAKVTDSEIESVK